MPPAHRRTLRGHAAPRPRGPWRITVSLVATAALVATASLTAAFAGNPGDTHTTTGQDFNLNITSPSDGASLPVGTTSVPVGGTITLGNVPATSQAHVSFVIDESGSLGTTNYATEKNAAIALFNKISSTPGLDVFTSLIFFSTGTVTVLPDQPADSNFVAAVNAHGYAAGSTYTRDAITAAQTQLTGKTGAKQIVLITDGTPNPSSQTPTPAQRSALDAAGIGVYTYAVGPDATCAPLTTISTQCTRVTDFASLSGTLTGTPPTGITGVDISVDGGGFTPVDSLTNTGQISTVAHGLAGGSNHIVLRGTADDHTTVLADVTVDVAVPDTTPPDTAITSGPSGTVATGSASFTYAGTPVSDTDHFVCTVDTHSVPCANSGASLSGLAVGTHTFTVAAVDAAGNVDPTPASRTWTVDAAPVAALGASPTTAETGQAVSLSTAGTTDPDGVTDLATWTLDFGDGSAAASGTGAPPAAISHAYAVSGPYVAKLTVTDQLGLSASATAAVMVNRSATRLVADPDIASVGVSALLSATGLAALVSAKVPLHPAATLTRTRDGSPVVGRTVTFTTTLGTPICSATTDSHGHAACGGLLTVIPITLGLGYNASFGGDTAYAPSGAYGALLVAFVRLL